MRPAADAVIVDSSTQTLEEVVDSFVAQVDAKASRA
jgi:cytidylate kinase